MRVDRRDWIMKVFEAVLLGLVVYLAARLAVHTLIRPEYMAPFWFANGIVLAVLLRRPLVDWPLLISAAFLGFSLNMILAGFSLFPYVIYGVVNVLEPTLAAVIIGRFRP